MSKQNYTITELKKELNQERHSIRRKIQKLGINPINEDNRAYKTESLKYDYQAFLDLSKEFEIEPSYNKNCDNSYNNCYDYVEADNRLIEQLKEDLKHERDRTFNLERLLDQQQKLSLNYQNKIKELEGSSDFKNEILEEKKESKKSKWYDLFNRKK